MASDTSSNIDTQVDPMSFSISDVQQPPFTGDPLEQPGPEPGPGPGPGSPFNAGTPEEILADESDACLDPNQNNPHSKARVRRGSTPPDYCPSQLVPEAGPIAGPKEPEAGRNAGDGVRSDTRLPKKKPQRFDPLNIPTFQDGETIENPCTRYTIAKNPVCDSGYFGPTINLAECRLCTFIDISFFYFLFFFIFFDFMILRTKIHIYIYTYIYYFHPPPRDSFFGLCSQYRKPLVLCHCEVRGEF